MTATPSRLRVVLDTDTFNEVDDQFALAHLLLSPKQVDLEAVYAAPFFIPGRCADPADGMEKSHEEILRVLEKVKTPRPPRVFRGSKSYLPAAGRPVESPAALDLVERALSAKEGKLHVLGIAVATDIASALLMEPKIADRIVIVWLGGHAPYWSDTQEFNLGQDLHAARVLLDTDVPLVLLPCVPVTSHLLVTIPELEKELAPYSPLGAYLTDIVRGYGKGAAPGWSKPIWDIAASAWAVNHDWVPAVPALSPVLMDNLTWDLQPRRRRIEIAREVNRNAIFADFFAKARQSGTATG